MNAVVIIIVWPVRLPAWIAGWLARASFGLRTAQKLAGFPEQWQWHGCQSGWLARAGLPARGPHSPDV